MLRRPTRRFPNGAINWTSSRSRRARRGPRRSAARFGAASLSHDQDSSVEATARRPKSDRDLVQGKSRSPTFLSLRCRASGARRRSRGFGFLAGVLRGRLALGAHRIGTFAPSAPSVLGRRVFAPPPPPRTDSHVLAAHHGSQLSRRSTPSAGNTVSPVGELPRLALRKTLAIHASNAVGSALACPLGGAQTPSGSAVDTRAVVPLVEESVCGSSHDPLVERAGIHGKTRWVVFAAVHDEEELEDGVAEHSLDRLAGAAGDVGHAAPTRCPPRGT